MEGQSEDIKQKLIEQSKNLQNKVMTSNLPTLYSLPLPDLNFHWFGEGKKIRDYTVSIILRDPIGNFPLAKIALNKVVALGLIDNLKKICDVGDKWIETGEMPKQPQKDIKKESRSGYA